MCSRTKIAEWGLYILFFGGALLVAIVCAIFLQKNHLMKSQYQEAICTLEKIHWVQDPTYQGIFYDKMSISNVTMMNQESFLYMLPQRCELSKYVAFVESNCLGQGSSTKCWAKVEYLVRDVRKSLPGDGGYMIGIIFSCLCLIIILLLMLYKYFRERSE